MRSRVRGILTVLAALAATAVLQTAAQAHFIWATVENNQVRFALLDDAGSAPDAKFEKYVAALAARGGSGGKALALGATKNGARFAPLPAGQAVAVADSIVGAKEREGEAYLLVYHAKGAASLAAAETVVDAPADLAARRDGRELVVSVRQDGWAVPYCEVWVQWPGDEAPTSVMTNVKGEARVAWPETLKGGFVGIRAMTKEAKAGTLEGKKYDAVHHWATLTFPVEGPKAAAKQAVAAGKE